ncbi:MAG: hypothetical protein IPO81_23005 [Kouleothrix sp.]|nr:hypothetical protein [Kouleothrix sp.]
MAEALRKIQADGTVLQYVAPDPKNDEPGGWYTNQPNRPINLARLADDQFGERLLSLASQIFWAAYHAGDDSRPEETDLRITSLAQVLTGYRHDPAFIEMATSLVTFDAKQNRLDYPNHPHPGGPNKWAVEEVRTQLETRRDKM